MKAIKLCFGKGDGAGVSHCVMAATSIVAGEPFTDRPECVCPTITAFLIRVNDGCLNDDMRERLLGHLPWLIIGTRGTDEHCIKRGSLFAQMASECAKSAVARAAAAAADAAAAATADAVARAAAAARADAVARAAEAAARAAAAAAAAAAADDDDAAWEQQMQKSIEFFEQHIIPVYHTMPVERVPVDGLVYVEGGDDE